MSPNFLFLLFFLLSPSLSNRNLASSPQVSDSDFNIFSYREKIGDDKIVFKNVVKAVLDNLNNWKIYFSEETMKIFLNRLADGYQGYSKDKNH